jgi:threonine/homoserine/homoserine lactone efflux protein
MAVELLGRGIIIGFTIAAPVGPIGVLCIRRTLNDGRWIGLLSGLGAATADAIYGAIAGFGITWLTNLLVNQTIWFRIVGGLFLCYLGVRTFLSKASDTPAQASSRGAIGAYLSTVVLTLTNPATILSFAAIFAGLGLASTAAKDHAGALWLVAGVFLGSALWWLILSYGANLVRERLTVRWLTWLNRISGLILISFGAIALSLPW